MVKIKSFKNKTKQKDPDNDRIHILYIKYPLLFNRIPAHKFHSKYTNRLFKISILDTHHGSFPPQHPSLSSKYVSKTATRRIESGNKRITGIPCHTVTVGLSPLIPTTMIVNRMTNVSATNVHSNCLKYTKQQKIPSTKVLFIHAAPYNALNPIDMPS